MGWWKINSVEQGKVDFNYKSPQIKDSKFVNAIPGDNPEILYNGDWPSDIMDDAIKKIREAYKQTWKREPYREEIQACFNFCTRGKLFHLEVEGDQPNKKDLKK